MPPITGSHSLLASSHSPHPSARLAVCLPDRCCWPGEWSGLPRSPNRIYSPFRLRLSPGSHVGTATHHPIALTDYAPILAKADNCRRPIRSYEGSVDDSHGLAMGVGSLASACPCNSGTWWSPSPDNTLLRARHCQSGFTPQGWPLTHADLMNWQVHARLGTPCISGAEQCD